MCPPHRMVSCLLLLALGLVLAGCSTTQTAAMRGLEPAEASDLLALQAQRQKPSEAREITDPARLAAHADQLYQRGEWPAALYEYGRALTLAPEADKPALRAKMAELSLRSHLFVPAESLYADLAKLQPRNAVFRQGLGLSRFAQGRAEEAKADLLSATVLDPSLWRAHNALGILANRAQQPQEALARFDRAIALMPEAAPLFNNRALARMLLKDWPRAEADLLRALTLDPGYRLAANNLGLVLARQGRQAEALRAFERGAGQAQAHNNLGVVLSWEGDHARAVEQFRQAVEAMPRYYPLAGRHLEILEGKLGPLGHPALDGRAVEKVSYVPDRREMPVVERRAPAATMPGPEPLPAPRRPGELGAMPQPMTERPEPAVERPRLAPSDKPRPLAIYQPTDGRPGLTVAAAPASDQPAQGGAVGLVGLVAEKDEANLVKGVVVAQDGLAHRLKGDGGGLVQGVAVGPGGDAGEANRAQRVFRGKIEGGDIGTGQ